mmetsp:Transcript_47085/g.109295  ORF Transcript_47085/g.109295 Transcript_47085/m.109295 type:complete len:222 (+) Transcript_47085:648-1313(+)
MRLLRRSASASSAASRSTTAAASAAISSASRASASARDGSMACKPAFAAVLIAFPKGCHAEATFSPSGFVACSAAILAASALSDAACCRLRRCSPLSLLSLLAASSRSTAATCASTAVIVSSSLASDHSSGCSSSGASSTESIRIREVLLWRSAILCRSIVGDFMRLGVPLWIQSLLCPIGMRLCGPGNDAVRHTLACFTASGTNATVMITEHEEDRMNPR